MEVSVHKKARTGKNYNQEKETKVLIVEKLHPVVPELSIKSRKH